MITITIDNPKIEAYFHHSKQEVLDFLTLNAIDETDRQLLHEVEHNKELQRDLQDARNGDLSAWKDLDAL